MKRRKRKRGTYERGKRSDKDFAHSRLQGLDRDLALIRGDIELLDRVLAANRPRGEYADTWTAGCREGMAIALDVVEGKLREVLIRSHLSNRPIRLRYYDDQTPTVKDSFLVIPTS